MSDGKRRLPVIGSGGSSGGAGDDRPPWQWAGIGAGIIFMFWMPLAYVAQIALRGFVASRLGAQEAEAAAEAYAQLEPGVQLEIQVASVVAPALALVVAAVAGGMVVGRFDGLGGRRNATIAGVVVASFAALFALSSWQAGSSAAWLVASSLSIALAAASARLGAVLGRSKGGAA